jgi:hypothetical protein
MIYLAIFLFFFFIGACVAVDRYNTPRIHKPPPAKGGQDRPFTSDELAQLGIKLAEPTRYDIETFIR